jgi:hypothetical protein
MRSRARLTKDKDQFVSTTTKMQDGISKEAPLADVGTSSLNPAAHGQLQSIESSRVPSTGYGKRPTLTTATILMSVTGLLLVSACAGRVSGGATREVPGGTSRGHQAEPKSSTETDSRAEAAGVAEAERQAEVARAVEAERQAEVARAVEAERQANAARVAEAERQAEAARVAEADAAAQQEVTAKQQATLKKAEEIISFIHRKQRRHVRESWGELANECFTRADLEKFERTSTAAKIAASLNRDPKFREVVVAIGELDANSRTELLTRANRPLRRTWAEIGRITRKGQTEAGNQAEQLIASAIVTLVEELLAKTTDPENASTP